MMVLMFQREVAERIVARENDEAYGRLGVLANWRAETKILFDISPAAFVPQPKVTSSVVRLVPRSAPEAVRPQGAGTGRGGGVRPAAQNAAAKPQIAGGRSGAAGRGRDVDLTRRAETVPVSGFVAMARELTDIRNDKIERALRRKHHGADASPIAGQVRCAAVRNHRRDAEAARQRSSGPHRALRAVPFRPAYPGRLCRSRRRQEARHHARHDAAVHAGARDRRHRRGSRPRCFART